MLITDPQFSIGAKILTSRPVDVVVTEPEAESTVPGGLVDPTQTSTTAEGETTTVAGETAAGTTSTVAPDASATTDLLTDESPEDSAGGTTSTTIAESTTTTTTLPPVEVIRETGTLRGQGPGQPLVVDFIEQTSTENALEIGSPVQTAGGATGIAPAGLPIGTVSAIRKQPGSSAPIVEVESAAGDLSRLTFVTVLLYLPSSGR
jgi:hypothetical protein